MKNADSNAVFPFFSLSDLVSAQRFGSARFRKSVETWV